MGSYRRRRKAARAGTKRGRLARSGDKDDNQQFLRGDV
jgi:hypothetical protein